MKMDYPLALLVALSLLVIPGNAASPLEDKVNALQAAIKDNPDSDAKPVSYPASPFNAQIMSRQAQDEFLGQMTSNPAAVDNLNATMVISQILAQHSSKAVQTAGQALLEELATERQAKADAYAAAVTDVLKRLRDLVAKSTKPSDFDGILIELQKYQNPGNIFTGQDQQALVQQVSLAYQFATGWQDYLSSLANGRTDEAQNQLRSLAQNSFGITIVPRSHILELMNVPASAPANQVSGSGPSSPAPPAPTVSSILDQVKTLGQMEGALAQIQAQNPPFNSPDGQTMQLLQQYVQSYHEIQNGLPCMFNLTNGLQSLPGHEEITRQMWIMALQALLSTAKSTPSLGEKPLDFVSDVISEATGRGDWDLLKKALEAKDSVTKSTQFGLYTSNPTDGVNSLIAALNQEAAGQYSLAVVSYETALKSPTLEIPAKMIGEKLAAIQRDHPADFQSGYKQTVQPYVQWPPPMNFRPGYPNMYPPPQPAVALSIPGKTKPSLPAANPFKAPTASAVQSPATPGK